MSAAQEKRDIVSARIGASIERGHVMTWLRERGERNKSIIYFRLADAIEQGAHISASVTGTGTAETRAARGEACQNGPQGDAQTIPQSQSVPPLEPPHNTRKG